MRFARLFGDLRQLVYPPEWRIRAQDWQPEGCVGDNQTTSENEEPAGTPDGGFSDDWKRAVCTLATSLWRLRQRMTDPETGRPYEETRRSYRHVESAWEALSEAGVEIQDHTNQPFDPGLSLSAIAFQQTPEIARETVIETIRPSVYLQGRMIQMGHVIVGVPIQQRGGHVAGND